MTKKVKAELIVQFHEAPKTKTEWKIVEAVMNGLLKKGTCK